MEFEGKTLKCVTIGDATVGKTCLLLSYAKDEFPQNYEATVFDNYCVTLQSSIGPIRLHLYDTAGNEGYEDLRLMAYQNADIYLVCFAINNYTSYEHIKLIWFKEIKQVSPGATIILVGTKTDLRQTGGGKISSSQGEALAKELKVFYIECSALTKDNVKEVFALALQAAVTHQSLGECGDHSDWIGKIKKRLCCCK